MNETKLSVRHRISEAGQVKAELSLKVQIPVCAAVADQLVLLLAKNNSRRLGRIEEILEPRRTDRNRERVIEVSINRVMPLCEQRIFQRGDAPVSDRPKVFQVFVGDFDVQLFRDLPQIGGCSLQ